MRAHTKHRILQPIWPIAHFRTNNRLCFLMLDSLPDGLSNTLSDRFMSDRLMSNRLMSSSWIVAVKERKSIWDLVTVIFVICLNSPLSLILCQCPPFSYETELYSTCQKQCFSLWFLATLYGLSVTPSAGSLAGMSVTSPVTSFYG